LKIMFTADWHLKLGQKNVPKDWALNRYNILFKELYKLEKQVDIHVIGGDLFDRVPNLEELELYFDFVKGVNIRTLIYPGNHEALKKTTTFLTNLKEVTSHLNPLVEIIDDYYKLENIDIIPYNKLKTFKPEDFTGNILMTHVRGQIPPHVHPEIDLSKFDRWKIVLAGDLHSHENSQLNIVYPGSPVTTSFHRNPVDTGIILFDNKTLEWSWLSIRMPQLLRQTVSHPDQMIKTGFHHTIYELEGDVTELSKVDGDSELLDKKVVKRNTESALDLMHCVSVEEELSEYLTKVLELNNKKVKNILGVFHDYIAATEME